ncbi:hypothetical protein T06_6990 [Trichinella sp. T6]|nr:hypothetical protein T06_6990 [Trichinella sp. T6]
MSCNCFTQKHFRFLLQALPNERCYNRTGARKLIESLFTCSVVLATVPTFQMVVGPQSHTMDIPKRNFTKPADLPKHSLEKVEEATLHPYSERIVRLIDHAACARRQISYQFMKISCLEWSGSKLFQNHKQISSEQVRFQVLPLWNGALQISGYSRADLS